MAEVVTQSDQVVEPAVSKMKFIREVEQFQALEDDYRRRGWFLLRAEFPTVLILMAAPQLSPAGVVTGVRFDYTNYDLWAPSVQLVNPFTTEPYRAKELPTQLLRGTSQALSAEASGPQFMVQVQQPLMQAHTPDDVPFLCLPGVREYHEHPGHSGDAWELHRPSGAGSLVRLLTVIHTYGVAPITGWGVALVPRVTFAQGEAAPS